MSERGRRGALVLLASITLLLAQRDTVVAAEIWVSPEVPPPNSLVGDWPVIKGTAHFAFGVPDDWVSTVRATIVVIGKRETLDEFEVHISIAPHGLRTDPYFDSIPATPVQYYAGVLQEIDVSDVVPASLFAAMDNMAVSFSSKNAYIVGLRFSYESVAADGAALEVERQARIDADAALRTDLTSEISARVAGDNALQHGLSEEVSARIAADYALQAGLTDEAAARQVADSNEAAARQAADNALDAGLTQEAGNRRAADIALENGLADEGLARAAGLADEAAARQANDAWEQQNRTFADAVLQDNLNTEAEARQLADSELAATVEGLATVVEAMPSQIITAKCTSSALGFPPYGSAQIRCPVPGIAAEDIVIVTNNRGGNYTSIAATPLLPEEEVLITLYNPLATSSNTGDLEYSILVVKP